MVDLRLLDEIEPLSDWVKGLGLVATEVDVVPLVREQLNLGLGKGLFISGAQGPGGLDEDVVGLFNWRGRGGEGRWGRRGWGRPGGKRGGDDLFVSSRIPVNYESIHGGICVVGTELGNG